MTATRWRIGDIPAAYSAIVALADECGLLPCIFGGVVKRGEGRDLDVLMVGRRGRTGRADLFLERFGGTRIKTVLRPLTGTESYEVERDGRIFNFVFGTVRAERHE